LFQSPVSQEQKVTWAKKSWSSAFLSQEILKQTVQIAQQPKTMKKTTLMIGVAAIAFLLANPASAQEKQAKTTETTTSGPVGNGNFIDSDKDGICDHFAARGSGRGQGRGFHNCNSLQKGNNTQGKQKRNFQKGPGFVDANQDGICDNAGKGRRGKGFCRANRKPVPNGD
jgi:hypothetical protein